MVGLGKRRIVVILAAVIILATFTFLWYYFAAGYTDKYDSPPAVFMDPEITDASTIKIITSLTPSYDLDRFNVLLRINDGNAPRWEWNISSPGGLNYSFDYSLNHYLLDFHDLNSNGMLDTGEYFEIHVNGDFPSGTKYTMELFFTRGDVRIGTNTAIIET